MTNTYESPLIQRYASQEMAALFSPQFKHSCWRELWIALAETQMELGLGISEEQIQEMRQYKDLIPFDKAADYEKQFRHDVMAHVHTFGDQCPKARPIIHLGATSCYVTDNSELVQIKEGLKLLQKKTQTLITQLASFADKWKDQACLGFTHYQPAQLTTVGKRACLWIQDFHMDLEELHYRAQRLRFLGVKGTTGTQASFMHLFSGDENKVKTLDAKVCAKMGFEELLPISGQTYTRKQDMQVVYALAGLASSAHKFATDLRLLANLKEIEEPFEKNQIGSSAMPYKRNPMRSERICALSRFLLSLAENPAYTHATQWLERSLDDSANRRLSLSEAFLSADAILNLLLNVTQGLVVYPRIIQKRIHEELPFMATENILMASVTKGGDRQELHERIRKHSQEAARQVKEEGRSNPLLEIIQDDPHFALSQAEMAEILDERKFVGRAPQQVRDFLAPILEELGDSQVFNISLNV